MNRPWCRRGPRHSCPPPFRIPVSGLMAWWMAANATAAHRRVMLKNGSVFALFAVLELVAGVVWEKNTVGWLVAGSWCWSSVREKHCWAGGCWSYRTEWVCVLRASPDRYSIWENEEDFFKNVHVPHYCLRTDGSLAIGRPANRAT